MPACGLVGGWVVHREMAVWAAVKAWRGVGMNSMSGRVSVAGSVCWGLKACRPGCAGMGHGGLVWFRARTCKAHTAGH